MLEVRDLNAYYGKSHILQGVNLDVAAGEVVSLLGRNGVGRSTTVKAIMGEIPGRQHPLQGRATSPGCRATASPAWGSAMCRRTATSFRASPWRQNLLLGQKGPAPPGALASRGHARHVPNLQAARRHAGGRAVGRRKQMLTMCRTLMGDPELIMIDEPTEGLAPLIVKQVGALHSRKSPGAAWRFCWWSRSCRSRSTFRSGSMSWGTAASSSRAPGRSQGQP